jgi:hypothetical protein
MEGSGRGPAAIDVMTLLFSVHARDAAPQPVLTRLAAYALGTALPGNSATRALPPAN